MQATSVAPGILRMPKALCMSGMAVAILLAALFTFDLVAPASVAPFRNASRTMDIVFVIGSLALGYLSWSTFREQV